MYYYDIAELINTYIFDIMGIVKEYFKYRFKKDISYSFNNEYDEIIYNTERIIE